MITIIDFYASWCGPCKQISPILEEIEKEYDYITVIKVNIEEDFEQTEKYGIRNIPTLLILKDDIIVDKIVGTTSKSKLLQIINKHK